MMGFGRCMYERERGEEREKEGGERHKPTD